jgi:hypothetical protein
MKRFAEFLAIPKGYPYRDRFAIAGIWVAMNLLWWHSGAHYTMAEGIAAGGLLLASLCGPKGRPYWLYVGVAIGAGLVQLLIWQFPHHF